MNESWVRYEQQLSVKDHVESEKKVSLKDGITAFMFSMNVVTHHSHNMLTRLLLHRVNESIDEKSTGDFLCYGVTRCRSFQTPMVLPIHCSLSKTAEGRRGKGDMAWNKTPIAQGGDDLSLHQEMEKTGSKVTSNVGPLNLLRVFSFFFCHSATSSLWVFMERQDINWKKWIR